MYLTGHLFPWHYQLYTLLECMPKKVYTFNLTVLLINLPCNGILYLLNLDKDGKKDNTGNVTKQSLGEVPVDVTPTEEGMKTTIMVLQDQLSKYRRSSPSNHPPHSLPHSPPP